MIVRINQIDVPTAELSAGWDMGNPRGAVEAAWPAGTFAYEVMVLDRDERDQPLPISFRQGQTRQLIPPVLAALADADDRVVLRFDGLLAEGELLAAVPIAADHGRVERFAFSATEKLDEPTRAAMTSIRLLPRPQHLTEICTDIQLGLERSVRLRAFAVPEELVNPLLDTADVDDERWRDILPRCAFALSTANGLLSLLIWTPRFNAAETKQRIMDKLSAMTKR
jgi:hypothetical protein